MLFIHISRELSLNFLLCPAVQINWVLWRPISLNISVSPAVREKANPAAIRLINWELGSFTYSYTDKLVCY